MKLRIFISTDYAYNYYHFSYSYLNMTFYTIFGYFSLETYILVIID